MKKRGLLHASFLKLSLIMISFSLYFPYLNGQNTTLDKVYSIDKFTFGYGKYNPDLPPLSEMESIKITIGIKNNVYVKPEEREQTVVLVLSDSRTPM